MSLPLKKFIGTQYYRPPNPKREVWSGDLKRIRSLGLKLVRTWLYWSKVNPKPEVWNFSEYDEFVKLAKGHNLHVLIQLVPESAPQWFVERHKDACYVDIKGTKVAPHARGMVSIGGYPGLCPDVAVVKAAIKEFIIRSVKHYSKLNIRLYDVWNEIMPFYSIPAILFHPTTQEKFRKWLKSKYKTLENLNRAWGGFSFTDWDQVRVPLGDNYAIWADILSFHREWIHEHMKWRVKLVKSVDPNAICVSHIGGGISQVTRAPFDVWQLARIVDVWGTSDYEIDFFRSAFLHSTMLSSSGKSKFRTWWLSEQAGGRTWTLFGDRYRTPEFILEKMILAISYGCSGNIIWQWRNESFGLESPNFGIVFEDGTLTSRAKYVSQLAKALENYSELFEDMHFDEPDVGLVLDWRLRVFEYTAFKEAGKFSENESLGWHKTLTVLGVNVEMFSLEEIVSNGIPPSIKLLIIPLLIQEVSGLYEKLLNFMSRGGFLIVGPYFLVYDEEYFMNYEVPPKEYQGLLGFKRKEVYYPREILVNVIKERSTLTLKGHHLVEEFELVNSTPLAHFKDIICGVEKGYGSGRAYSLGTFLGVPSLKDPKGLAEFLSPILEAAKCKRFPLATNSVVTRLAHTSHGDLLFVFNPSSEEKTTIIKIPKSRKFVDLLKDKELKPIKDDLLLMKLNGYDAKIILLL